MDAVLETVTSQTPQVTPETPQPPPALSVKEHTEQFGPEALKAEPTPPADATDAARPGETEAQAQQRRDKATGQYRTGKHRARSQQATSEDVPRIRELTAKHRAAEEKALALEKRLADIERTKQTPQAAATPPPTPQPSAYATTDDPEPQETDEKYAGDYSKYFKDVAAWTARSQWREQQAQQQFQQQADAQQAQWETRIAAAKAKYPDFETVAFTPVPWQPGSLVDQYVKFDDAGPEILYHLQSHPDELDNLGRMTSEFAARRFLSLLSQRLLSPLPEAAGTNGAAPRTSPVVLPPKPPTPLRTEAQRATPTPPATNGSLSIAEHTRHFGPKAR